MPQLLDIPGTESYVLLIYLTVEFYRPGFTDETFLSIVELYFRWYSMVEMGLLRLIKAVLKKF